MSKISICLLLALAAEGLCLALLTRVLGLAQALILLILSMMLGLFIISARRKKLHGSGPEQILEIIPLAAACFLFIFPGLLSDVLGYLLLLPGINRPAQRVLQGRFNSFQQQVISGDNFFAKFYKFDNFSSRNGPGRTFAPGSTHNVVDADFTVVDEDQQLPAAQEAQHPERGSKRR